MTSTIIYDGPEEYNKALLEKLLLSTKSFSDDEQNLMLRIIPELSPMVNCSQNHPAHYLNVFDHTIKVIEYIESNLMLKLVALLHDSGKPDTKTVGSDGVEHFKGHGDRSVALAEDILRKLGYDKTTSDEICNLIKYHDLPTKPTMESIKETAAAVGDKNLSDLFYFQLADMKAHEESYGNRKTELLKQVIALLDRSAK